MHSNAPKLEETFFLFLLSNYANNTSWTSDLFQLWRWFSFCYYFAWSVALLSYPVINFSWKFSLRFYNKRCLKKLIEFSYFIAFFCTPGIFFNLKCYAIKNVKWKNAIALFYAIPMKSILFPQSNNLQSTQFSNTPSMEEKNPTQTMQFRLQGHPKHHLSSIKSKHVCLLRIAFRIGEASRGKRSKATAKKYLNGWVA